MAYNHYLLKSIVELQLFQILQAVCFEEFSAVFAENLSIHLPFRKIFLRKSAKSSTDCFSCFPFISRLLFAG